MEQSNKKIILFGAGVYGLKALKKYGQERVHCFVDNNEKLIGTDIQGMPIISFAQLKDIYHKYQIVITVSGRFISELSKQLEDAGIYTYEIFAKTASAAGGAEDNVNYVEVFRKAERWLLTHTVQGEGIISNTGLPRPYPEVTGYFIPSLLRWGLREQAASYARWLCSIQKEDGSWFEATGQAPYVFDSAQILKGLLAAREIVPEADQAIIRGCDWILSNMAENGRLVTPDETQWIKEECSDLIHLYCLQPL